MTPLERTFFLLCNFKRLTIRSVEKKSKEKKFDPTCIRGEEGVWGFYRGFGGMLLQYAVRLAAVHALSLVAKELANLIMDPPPPGVIRS